MWRRSARREVRAEAVSRPGWSSAFQLVGLGLLRTTAGVDDVESVEGGENGGWRWEEKRQTAGLWMDGEWASDEMEWRLSLSVLVFLIGSYLDVVLFTNSIHVINTNVISCLIRRAHCCGPWP